MDAKERDRKIKIVLLEVQQALLTPSEGLKAIRDVSEEYAKQKCKEQRDICAEHFPPIKGYSNVYDDIKKAPLATEK